MYHHLGSAVLLAVLALALPSCSSRARMTAPGVPAKASLWVDLRRGEVVRDEELLADLSNVQVIYIGEVHSIARHHLVQQMIVDGLYKSGKSVLLGLEMMDLQTQTMLDHYNRGEISLDRFIELTQWNRRWSNWRDYTALVETVHAHGGTIVALNAPAKLVHKVGRKGLRGLTPQERAVLPKDMDLKDGTYKQLMLKMLAVHASMNPKHLEPVFQAQVVRDETMAHRLVERLKGTDSVAVVVAGDLHVAYGLGIPARVQRLLPGVKDRIVLVTESGELVLAEAQKKMAREMELSHEDLRFIKRPIGDYLYATEVTE